MAGAFPFAVESQIVTVIAGVLGIAVGAVSTGLVKAWADRVDRRNKWREFERGNARGFMQHIAVHCRDGEVSDADERLLGHYYTLALAVPDDGVAAALFADLPEHLRSRAHNPEEEPFKGLRSEVTPGRKRGTSGLASPGATKA
jgi:hypothetical protein